jgi:hypothetical protein
MLLQDLGEPAFGQEGFDECRQLSRRGFSDERRPAPVRWLPTPFEAIVFEVAKGLAMPGDDKIESRFVGGFFVSGCPGQQVPLGTLSFPIPLVLPRQNPDRVSGRLSPSYSSHSWDSETGMV